MVNTIRNLAAGGGIQSPGLCGSLPIQPSFRAFEQQFRKYGIRPKIVGGQEFFQRKEVKDAAAYLKLILNERDDQSLLRVLGVPPRGIGDKAIERLRELQKVSPVMSLMEITVRADLSEFHLSGGVEGVEPVCRDGLRIPFPLSGGLVPGGVCQGLSG